MPAAAAPPQEPESQATQNNPFRARSAATAQPAATAPNGGSRSLPALAFGRHLEQVPEVSGGLAAEGGQTVLRDVNSGYLAAPAM
jgi:hypothetical protein